MLKRLLVAFPIFFGLLILLLVPVFIRIYRAITTEGMTGIGFSRGSLAENFFRLLVLLLLAIAAYWISGKLLRVA